MLRLLLLLSSLAACTPSPRKAVMPNPTLTQTPSPVSGNTVQAAIDTGFSEPVSAKSDTHAMQGPVLEPVSAAGIPAPTRPAGRPAALPAAVLGRRTVSTAFVRVGPDGHLTVKRHDGHVLVLRDVTMDAKTYCGVQLSGTRYCGDYAEVATARPGGATTPDLADPGSGTRAKPAS